MAPGPGAPPQTPANPTIRAEPFVRALICWQSLRSTGRTASSPHLRRPSPGAPVGVIVSAAILRGFREAIPRESIHTTASHVTYCPGSADWFVALFDILGISE
jgi:hypothetical protein